MDRGVHRGWLWLAALVLAAFLLPVPLLASEHRGNITFGGLPVPGATVTATQGDQKFTTTTDQQGVYSFPDLRDGTWTMRVEMQGFVTQTEDVAVMAGVPGPVWELKLLPLDELLKQAREAPKPQSAAAPPLQAPASQAPTSPPPTSPSNDKATADKKNAASQKAASTKPPEASFPRTDVNAAPAAPSASAAAQAIPGADSSNQQELAQKAADGLLINGSAINGASSQFAQNAAFGNSRSGPGSLYNGSIGVILDNSALDARPFSLTGQDTPKPAFGQVQGVATLGGPLRIPHLLNNGGTFFVGYQWSGARNASTQSALVPTAAQREGNLGAISVNPALISPQATALLNFYPLPNFNAGGYNYQTALVSRTQQNSLQSRLTKSIDQRNQVWGSFAFQKTSTQSTNLFQFQDDVHSLGLNTAANWQHRVGQRMFVHLQFQYSRLSTRTTPFFENREDVSAIDGIGGNSQSPSDWGPPTLNFSSGIASLTDVQSSLNRNQTATWSFDTYLYRGHHNFQYGIDFRRQQFNYLGQQDARGTFTFTGAATGSDFGDFLAGIPDTSSIAFGNTDKYFRESVWDAYATDDWRIGPALTVNAGARWEYGAPITELYGRMVNLDAAPGFTAVAPVIAANPVGPLTGQSYPNSLLRPDKHGIEPRIGLAWRPFPASSTVIRAGYGVYYNTSVYQSVALQMAQQAPLSKSLRVQNSAADPLTLAQGFNASLATVPQTFAVDPNFRMGYTQNWQASIQRDLPGSMVLTATYNGIKGTRGMQEYLPNTYPLGAPNPCPACPIGFTYEASNGNSTRESGQIQLRRRLHNGITATLQYTYSRSIDDSALGGRGQATYVTAQNWLDLGAERGPSAFDQRNVLSVQMQYTTGMGLGGGTLLSGWKGTLLKDWLISSQITAGSGLPLTPQYLAGVVPGTGVTGPIRPDLTGAPLYAASGGLHLNPQAYTPPLAGQWGDAGRDSIVGPSQFSLNAGLARTFRLKDRYSLDLRVDSINALNHVTYTGWNSIISSPQFGLPTGTSPMRSLQMTLRVRF